MSKTKEKQALGWTQVGVDLGLAMAFLVLLVIGAVMVASSSIAVAEKTVGDAFYYFKRHLLFIGLGGLIGLGIMGISSEWMKIVSTCFDLGYFGFGLGADSRHRC